MKQIITLTIIILSINSLAQNKMITNYSLVSYNVEFVTSNNKNQVLIKINFPEKYFHKKSYMHLRFYATMNNGTTYDFEDLTFQGYKIKNNKPVINYKKADYYTHKQQVSASFKQNVEKIFVSGEIFNLKNSYALPNSIIYEQTNKN